MDHRKKKLVVLTGAGISAESGLKTFRDGDGLWESFDISEVATPGAWKKDAAKVLNFYNMRRRNVMDALPNAAHYELANLETDFDITIITQNIDDLHERAGSGNIVHLHGEILKMRSERSNEPIYPIEKDIYLGHLAPDGGQLRPHIVWFEEPVPMIETAVDIVREADIFVIIGTSLQVYPAAGLVGYAPDSIPKFVVDKKVPFTSLVQNLQVIEKPATEGIIELKEKLLLLK
ncbi:MAG: NAD-dependent deacylase [Chitinophagaceae bacterium]|nr:NAD-dependent deacylase [Chitinophagaceae bacterium]